MDPRLLQLLMTIFGQGSGNRFNFGTKGRGNRFGDSSSPADFDDGSLLGALSQLNNQENSFVDARNNAISSQSQQEFDANRSFSVFDQERNEAIARQNFLERGGGMTGSDLDQDIPPIKSRQISDRSLPRFTEDVRFGGGRR